MFDLNKTELDYFNSLKINPKIFEIGDVVYFVHKTGREWSVKYAVVAAHYTSEICLQLIEPIDTRTINGTPIKDFVTPTKWMKLPKGWSWNTRLFVEGNNAYTELIDKFKQCHIDNPLELKAAYQAGALVDVQDNDHCKIESVIDRKNGYRLERRYNTHHATYVSLCHWQIYKTYKEAQSVIDEHNAELKRIAEISDYDWNVEQITNEVDRWSKMSSISDEEKQAYLDWILKHDNVEDIEVRVSGGELQWKYVKNKRWQDIFLQ